MAMLEADNLTYSFQNRPAGSVKPKPSERALISLERSQKLDLLIHLLTNLQKTLIISGPEGIGKTTVLNTLQESHQSIWPICILQGSSSLSFESVINQLSRFLNLSSVRAGFDLSVLRTFCEKQKVVLAIDDAADLVPGLINELMDLADSMRNLRLVFSMNYDAFQSNSSSESAFEIDACHFIELPPLNQKQCLEYLQNLSAQSGALLSFNAITDALVDRLYQQTQGIPGKLLAELPKLSQYQSRQHRKVGLGVGIILILVTTGFILSRLLPSSVFQALVAENPTESAPPINVLSAPIAANPPLQQPPTITNLPSAVANVEQVPSLDMSKTEAMSKPKPLEDIPSTKAPSQLADLKNPVQLQELTETKPAIQTLEATVKAPTPSAQVTPAILSDKKQTQHQAPVAEQPLIKPKPASSGESGGGDSDWITAQPANHFTLQVMVLSSKASATRFLNKHAQYRDQLKYYVIGNEDHEKYVLIYGSFPASSDALQQKSDMPSDFSQSLIKPFKQIQKESRRKNNQLIQD